jgi:5'(3')-deoxyribonucleotidase
MNKLVFLDMDGVVADFIGAVGEYRGYGAYPEMYERGFFHDLEPLEGALVNVRRLIKHDSVDLWILTQPVKESAHSYSEKVQWVMKWFPELSHRIVMSQEKGFLAAPGRYLIDDSDVKWKNKWEQAGGTFIHFNEFEPHQSWGRVFETLEIPL